MQWRVWGILALMGVGCSKQVLDGGHDNAVGPPFSDGSRSGTRLKLVWRDYDGTRTPAGLFDAERDVRCEPTIWNDGKTYCTPAYSWRVVFLDAACTVPAGLAPGYQLGCAPPPLPDYYRLEKDPGPDRRLSQLYPRGEKITSPPRRYYERTNGQCEQSTDYLFDLYALGPELTASGLVELTRERFDTPDRIAPQFLTSADGARMNDGAYDTMLGMDCRFVRDDDGSTGTCQLQHIFPTDSFGDPGCTQLKPAAAPTTKFVYTWTWAACGGWDTRTYAVGETVAAEPLYRQDHDRTCEPASPPTFPDETYHTATEVFPLQVARAREATDRALQLLYYPDGANRWRDPRLYDRLHETECDEVRLPDGSYRCLPSQRFETNFYTDPDCTKPIRLMAFRSEPGCPAPALPRYGTVSLRGSCDETPDYQVWEVGPEYKGPLFWSLAPKSFCDSADPGFYYQPKLVAKPPLEEFPLATTVTDP